MKIYTKTGDKGTTSLVGGSRASKADPRLNAYGDVDELNSWIGYIVAVGAEENVSVLQWIQNRLFDVGAILATPADVTTEFVNLSEDIKRLETEIDELYAKLPPQTGFILPGGTQAAAAAHIARTVCRRAERAIVGLESGICPMQTEVLAFVNRLSDYLFALARTLNHNVGMPETYWSK